MRTSRYCYRVIVVVPAALKDTINALVYQQLDPSGGMTTLSVGLSASGQEPATHYWCASSLVEAAMQKLAGLSQAFPTVQMWIWRLDNTVGQLSQLFAGCPNVQVGLVTPEAALTAAGLQRLATAPLTGV